MFVKILSELSTKGKTIKKQTLFWFKHKAKFKIIFQTLMIYFHRKNDFTLLKN